MSYLVTGKNGRFYWYYKYDGSATATLEHGRIFETVEEAERVFDKALEDGDAEEATLYEIGDDGNARILASALGGSRLRHGKGDCGGDCGRR